MSGFRRVALLQAHAAIPVWAEYYIPDLVELCMLAAAVRPLAGAVDLPVHPNARNPLGEFERYLKRCRPDLVDLSVFTCGVPSALQYAEAAKRSGAVAAAGEVARPSRPDRPGGIARKFALRFHLEGRPSIWIGGGDDGTTGTMAVRVDGPRLPDRWEVHVDLARLAALGDRTDHRLLSDDALTLFWTPTAFRLGWVPGFVRETVRVLAGLAGMAWFYGRTALRRRRKAQSNNDGALDAAPGAAAWSHDDRPKIRLCGSAEKLHCSEVRAQLTAKPARSAAYMREYLGRGVFALMQR